MCNIREINGMTIVNGGTIVNGLRGPIEVLGPGYSTHRDRMVCIYAMEGNRKVVCVYAGGDIFIVYRYKNSKELHHYGSWKIPMNTKNQKYKLIKPELISEWNNLFGKR